ncbi:hypothetical protein [Streptomyces sp. enrichment culture]|uniref:hypothetical protein n=1 Tax=Streptomyces sp. enrichment culture TaxID=1795815 RepID=UPI003F549D06
MWKKDDRLLDAQTRTPCVVVSVNGPAPYLYGIQRDGCQAIEYRYAKDLRRISRFREEGVK